MGRLPIRNCEITIFRLRCYHTHTRARRSLPLRPMRCRHHRTFRWANAHRLGWARAFADFSSLQPLRLRVFIYWRIYERSCALTSANRK